eukprot:1954098-Rhodomonas_salina.2
MSVSSPQTRICIRGCACLVATWCPTLVDREAEQEVPKPNSMLCHINARCNCDAAVLSVPARLMPSPSPSHASLHHSSDSKSDGAVEAWAAASSRTVFTLSHSGSVAFCSDPWFVLPAASPVVIIPRIPSPS